jgi:glutamine synthetase
MMAESLDYIATELEKLGKVNKGLFNEGVQKLLQKIMKGARHRGLQRRRLFPRPGIRKPPRWAAQPEGPPPSLPVLTSKEIVELFTTYGVLSEPN